MDERDFVLVLVRNYRTNQKDKPEAESEFFRNPFLNLYSFWGYRLKSNNRIRAAFDVNRVYEAHALGAGG